MLYLVVLVVFIYTVYFFRSLAGRISDGKGYNIQRERYCSLIKKKERVSGKERCRVGKRQRRLAGRQVLVRVRDGKER